MPSKKKTTRAAQLQPHPQPTHSDYDTDTAVTDAAPPMPPPPGTRTNTELNLLVLRRYVPSIERIIAIAPFAVVYLFSPETQAWEKSGHEGTLFVCQLSGTSPSSPAYGGGGHARYNVVILNRKSLDNFIMELFSGEDIEITEQYVILQVVGADGTPSIYGLWIFSDDEDGSAANTREIVAGAIQECAVRAEHARMGVDVVRGRNGHGGVPSYNLDGAGDVYVDAEEQGEATPIEPQSSGQQIDLLSLFNKPSPSSFGQAASEQPKSQPPPGQSAAFTSTADTDFFRSSHSPAAAAQQAPTKPPGQQNVLLDLFKSAKKT